METKEKITWIICVTILILAVLVFAWYIYATQSPAITVFRMEMDNNTLQAAKVMAVNV